MSGLNFLERLLDGAAVEWKPLGELAENLDFMRKPVTSGLRDSGKIPYYGASGIVDYVKDYIFDGDFLLVSEDGANLVARNTPIAFSISGKSWVNNHAHILKFNTYAERRYIEYYLNSIDLTPYISGSAQPKLNQKNLNSIKIPNPSLTIQAEIVRILD
ncbi:MAG: restriction endonuclease subunit S, partial [Synechocystis sp.]